jgi:Fe-S cluster biogenesis protein NfuA
MPDEKDFQRKVQRIGELVGELENIAEPEARAGAKALLQLILDLHATGLERALEILAKNGDLGQRAIDDLGDDPLVSSLLVLYGLHPLDLETRIERAVERLKPRVRKGGGQLELLEMEHGMVRLHIEIAGHSCGSTGRTLQAMVEDALYAAAPDMSSLLIVGLEEKSASGFVPLGKLGGAVAAAPAMSGSPVEGSLGALGD